MRIVDRYIVRELLPPFLLGVGGVLVLLVGDVLYTLAGVLVGGRMSAGAIIRLLAFKLPAILVVTFPVATLLAVLLGLTRLARDHELQAMRLAGMSLPRMLLPVIMFGAAVAGSTLFVNEAVTPWGNRRANAVLRETLPDAFPVVREQVFLRTADERVIYVGHVDERTRVLRDVMLYDLGRPYPRLTTAKSVSIVENRWVLRDGVVREFDAQGFTTVEAAFAVMVVPVVDRSGAGAVETHTPEEMTFRELHAQLRAFGPASPARVLVEYHRKLAVPLASLAFALVAGPLSLLASRGGRFAGVGLSVLLLFAYYVAMSVSRALGEAGGLPPPAAAWVPNILCALAGLALLLRENGVAELTKRARRIGGARA